MKYYSHHIGDFDRATRHLTRIERSIYRDLIELYYVTEQQLSLDLTTICRKIVARSNEESTLVEQTLNEFFTKTPTGWYHERCEAEIDAYRNATSQKSIAGKASAAKKAQKRQRALNGDSTDVEIPLNGDLTASQLTSSQEPVTNNHKPGKPKTTPSGDLFDGVSTQIVADFKAMRRKQKAEITKTSVEGIQREAKKAGLSFEDALMICCERNWRGFKAEWITQPAHGPPHGYESVKDRSRRETIEGLTGRNYHDEHKIIDVG